MRNLGLITFIIAVLVLNIMMNGCNTAANNTNANVNRNTNVAVTNTNANRTTNTNRWSNVNANITREDYDRDRAEYERDRGDSTIGQGVNDSWLWFKTRAALMTTDDLRDSTINVDVVNDVVTLRGTVANASQKSRAEQVAKGIQGVKSVKNELKVAPDDSVTNINTSNSNRR